MTWETPQDIKQKWAKLSPLLQRKADGDKKMLHISIIVVRGLPLIVNGSPLMTIRECPLEPRKTEVSTNTWWQPIRRIQSICSDATGMIEVSICVSNGLPIFWTTPQLLQIEQG